jgi:immunoglobulin-binding protein 1
MAINYHLAELIQKVFTPEVSSRKEHLLQARARYERFLKLLDSYDMLSKGDAKLFESYNEDKQNFSTVSTKDAAARRDVKIARFREEKELKRKIEVRSVTIFLGRLTLTFLHVVPATEPKACRAR